ncbi:MAG: hypothetical protein ACRDVG_13520 [Jatrophihabitantaceae bacterium]
MMMWHVAGLDLYEQRVIGDVQRPAAAFGLAQLLHDLGVVQRLH